MSVPYYCLCMFLYSFHLNVADSDYQPYIKFNALPLLLIVHVFYVLSAWLFIIQIISDVLMSVLYYCLCMFSYIFHLNVEDSDYQPYIKLNANVLLLIVHVFLYFSVWALLIQIISDGLMSVPYYCLCMFLYIFHLNVADSDFWPYINLNANALLLIVHGFYFFRLAIYNLDYKRWINVSALLLFVYVFIYFPFERCGFRLLAIY